MTGHQLTFEDSPLGKNLFRGVCECGWRSRTYTGTRGPTVEHVLHLRGLEPDGAA